MPANPHEFFRLAPAAAPPGSRPHPPAPGVRRPTRSRSGPPGAAPAPRPEPEEAPIAAAQPSPPRSKHLHRHERRHVRLNQQTLTHLPPPRKQQALAQPMPCRNVADPSARLVRLPDDAKLIRRAPLPPTLATSDDLHHTSIATLTSDLKRREAHAQAALAGQIRGKLSVAACTMRLRDGARV